jgi:hypothetical protein
MCRLTRRRKARASRLSTRSRERPEARFGCKGRVRGSPRTRLALTSSGRAAEPRCPQSTAWLYLGAQVAVYDHVAHCRARPDRINYEAGQPSVKVREDWYKSVRPGHDNLADLPYFRARLTDDQPRGEGEMTIEMTENERRNYLKDEYLLLQNQYEDYDKRSLTIKGWVSAGAAAALALAPNSSFMVVGLFLPISVAVIVAAIWWLEAYWKVFQYALNDRIRMIEAYFRNEPDILIKDPGIPFQTYNWWYKSYQKDEPIYEYERTKIRPRPKSLPARLRAAAWHRYRIPALFAHTRALCRLVHHFDYRGNSYLRKTELFGLQNSEVE